MKTLSVDPVQLQRLPKHVNGVVAELVDDTLGLLHVVLLRLWLPPVNKHPIGVVLASSVVEAVSDFVPYNHPNGTIGKADYFDGSKSYGGLLFFKPTFNFLRAVKAS